MRIIASWKPYDTTAPIPLYYPAFCEVAGLHGNERLVLTCPVENPAEYGDTVEIFVRGWVQSQQQWRGFRLDSQRAIDMFGAARVALATRVYYNWRARHK